MSPEFIFVMKDLRKVVPPNREILKGIWLSFFFGAKIGVIGANGAGKSSLLRIMAGEDPSFLGEAFPAKSIKVGLLPQEPKLDSKKNVLGNIEEGVAETRALLDRFNAISARFAEPLEPDEMEKLLAEQARVQDQIDAANAWELDRTLEIAMDALRCPPPDQEVATLSGGERRRVALCRLLLQRPDLLLLDEPTNHLDAESVAWLERFLKEYPGTVVAVTHDRYFLDNVAGWILELDRGAGIPWEGNYSSWLDQKRQRLAVEEKQASARQRTLERELEWVRMAPRARQAKGKARLAAYERMIAEETERLPETVEIYVPPGPRLGKLAIEAEGLRKAYGENVLFDDLSFKLPPGGIVGVIGPNGAGKTTLFRIIVGQEKADAGALRVGETVKFGYVDQSRDALPGEANVWEAISDGRDTLELGKRSVNSRAYVASFNFKGADQQKRVKDLSGGERNRVHLARMLRSGANVLLLDEPTNDLDVDTLRALEEALLQFAGCVVVISHDRWFLDRIATHMLAFEGDSRAVWFEGNYQDYEAGRRQRLGAEADSPHRIRYKKLVRG
ncbi:MAG: energy-dependent translational throttle protein EttA [Candidatus Eisenbacteria bacterium]|uniref:Energy-dependent translational throttle protein EttA n=1 Tax=Eiseniibacteriota bacterium TaxID=2212470 RepID=A0A538SLN2_UNCEI|nr:MAG: energy-dependent translational throttle protein EttA [Candidatus Eisenbacteria bacterium]